MQQELPKSFIELFNYKNWQATPSDAIIFFLLLTIAIILIAVWRSNQRIQDNTAHAQQLFLFKSRQTGLSNFEYKILNGMSAMLNLKDPAHILEDSLLFESAIAGFLDFLRSRNETAESISSICREIIIIYEKIYYPFKSHKPLAALSEIEEKRLVILSDKATIIAIAKIIGKQEQALSLILLGTPHDRTALAEGKVLDVYFWRDGDAEYTFTAAVLSIDKKILDISLPAEFSRGKEARHPFVDIISPCVIIETIQPDPVQKNKPELQQPEPEFEGVIFKINELSCVVRTTAKLDFNKIYSLHFEISDFSIWIESQIISNRITREQNVFYYTFKFRSMSSAALSILKTFVAENLSVRQ